MQVVDPRHVRDTLYVEYPRHPNFRLLLTSNVTKDNSSRSMRHSMPISLSKHFVKLAMSDISRDDLRCILNYKVWHSDHHHFVRHLGDSDMDRPLWLAHPSVQL